LTTPIDDTTPRVGSLAEDKKTLHAKNGGIAQKREETAEVREACQQFEEIFLRILLKEARIDRSLGGGEEAASKMYGDMTREALAKALTQAGGLGLADVLYRQLSREDMPAEVPELDPDEQEIPGLAKIAGQSGSDE
jgi:Rod binding domain-containing protein